MMRRLALATLAAVVAAGAAGGRLREDPPSVAPPAAGSLTGVIAPAAKVARLEAVSRVTGRRYAPAAFDRESGRFRFDDLPGDAAYDVCVVDVDGRRVEGIDLDWFEARFVRLAAARRKELGIPDPPAHRFGAADVEALERLIADRKDFSNINRPLIIRGYGSRAVMLVERIRDRRFHGAGKGEVIWRTDLLYFTWDAGGWRLLPNARRLVERRRFEPKAWATFTLGYASALSGRVEADGRSRPVRYTLPAVLPAATSRRAGDPPAPRTRPKVLGLPKPTSQPAADGRSVR